jgi:hypothetical protein
VLASFIQIGEMLMLGHSLNIQKKDMFQVKFIKHGN